MLHYACRSKAWKSRRGHNSTFGSFEREPYIRHLLWTLDCGASVKRRVSSVPLSQQTSFPLHAVSWILLVLFQEPNEIGCKRLIRGHSLRRIVKISYSILASWCLLHIVVFFYHGRLISLIGYMTSCSIGRQAVAWNFKVHSACSFFDIVCMERSTAVDSLIWCAFCATIGALFS